jgi:hypothetical protein
MVNPVTVRDFDIRGTEAFDIDIFDPRICPPWTPNWPARS